MTFIRARKLADADLKVKTTPDIPATAVTAIRQTLARLTSRGQACEFSTEVSHLIFAWLSFLEPFF